MLDLDLPAQVALSVSVVAGLRSRLPKLDGWYVVLAVAGASLLTALVAGPSEAFGEFLRHACLLFLYSVGGMSAAQHVAKAVGQGLASKPGAPPNHPNNK